MYFVILFYGMNVARSIIEEKTSRIFEVLLATIRPEELLAGKVIGVGSVGLTQVAIWITAGAILGSSGLMAASDSIHLTWSQGIFFVIFFLLGYILYSSIAAALGAMTSSEQELQQMNIFLMLPLIASSTVIYRVVTDPTGFISRVFSFFPFCTPLIMYVRIAVGGASGLEIALSIIELILTIWLVLWIASRIYRVGILMYGKRPNLPEIIRWLKYS
jgi:ABC-2 type transport system permease protein